MDSYTLQKRLPGTVTLHCRCGSQIHYMELLERKQRLTPLRIPGDSERLHFLNQKRGLGLKFPAAIALFLTPARDPFSWLRKFRAFSFLFFLNFHMHLKKRIWVVSWIQMDPTFTGSTKGIGFPDQPQLQMFQIFIEADTGLFVWKHLYPAVNSTFRKSMSQKYTLHNCNHTTVQKKP